MSREAPVDPFWRTVVWRQFGAAIDMLENAIAACPDALWSDPDRTPAWQERGVVGFWYLVFHTLFFLDYYLTDSATSFRPPAPFPLDELDPAGILPARPYTKAELAAYLAHCRARCRAAVEGLTDEEAKRPTELRPDLSRAELLLYNLRHVQHHTAQLNLLLRQETGDAPRWVAVAR